MNTYGLRSVNTGTFNLKWHTNYTYPERGRNILVTGLKMHNLTLNVLGYIPGVSLFSGCARILSGIIICAVTLAVGDPTASKGVIIGHWFKEALLTGITQIARGVLEAFVPYGWIVNATLDVTATVHNFLAEFSNSSVCTGCMGYTNHGPYPDPKYPFPFSLLNLV
jgi:hypothetical protein